MSVITNKEEAEGILKAVLMDQSTSDVIFQVGNDKIYAHRCILAQASRPFRSMLYGNMRESKEKYVVIGTENTTPLVFREFIEYIYTRKTTLYPGNIFPLLNLSRMYEIVSLQQACEDYLAKMVVAGNAVEMLIYAYENNEQKVMSNVLKVIAHHTQEAISHQSFMKIDPYLLLIIVQQEAMNISELDLFLRVVEWVRYDRSRTSHSEEILKYIRYACIPQGDLVTKVKPTELAPLDLYHAALEFHCAPTFAKDYLEPLQSQMRMSSLKKEIFLTCNFEFAIAQSENGQSHKGYFLVGEQQFSQLCPYFLQFHRQKGIPALDSFLSKNWAVRVASGKHIKFPQGFLSLQRLSLTKGQPVPLHIHPSYPLPTDNYSSYMNVTFAGSVPGSNYPVLCIKQSN